MTVGLLDAPGLEATGDALMAQGDWSAAREAYERAAGTPADSESRVLAKWLDAGTERALEKIAHGDTGNPVVVAWIARARAGLAEVPRPFGRGHDDGDRPVALLAAVEQPHRLDDPA